MFKNIFRIIIFSMCLLLAGCTNSSVILKNQGPSIKTATSKPVLTQPLSMIRVVDGDTIVVKYNDKQEKVRFIGVNTPETVSPQKGVEPFGPEASAFTKKLLENQKVQLEFDVGQRDKYDRLLAYVYLVDGTFVNAKLVEEGYAQVMTIQPNVKYQDVFLKLQRTARDQNKGLWSLEFYKE